MFKGLKAATDKGKRETELRKQLSACSQKKLQAADKRGCSIGSESGSIHRLEHNPKEPAKDPKTRSGPTREPEEAELEPKRQCIRPPEFRTQLDDINKLILNRQLDTLSHKMVAVKHHAERLVPQANGHSANPTAFKTALPRNAPSTSSSHGQVKLPDLCLPPTSNQ